MKNYFENCNTADELKTRYRKLATELHPDKGGTSTDFAEMKNQYEQKLKELVSRNFQKEKDEKSELEKQKLAELALEFLKFKYPQTNAIIGMIRMYDKSPFVQYLKNYAIPPQYRTLYDFIINIINK